MLFDFRFRSILSLAIIVKIFSFQELATKTPSRSYFLSIDDAIAMIANIKTSVIRYVYSKEKMFLYECLCSHSSIQFQTDIYGNRGFAMLRMSAIGSYIMVTGFLILVHDYL